MTIVAPAESSQRTPMQHQNNSKTKGAIIPVYNAFLAKCGICSHGSKSETIAGKCGVKAQEINSLAAGARRRQFATPRHHTPAQDNRPAHTHNPSNGVAQPSAPPQLTRQKTVCPTPKAGKNLSLPEEGSREKTMNRRVQSGPAIVPPILLSLFFAWFPEAGRREDPKMAGVEWGALFGCLSRARLLCACFCLRRV